MFSACRDSESSFDAVSSGGAGGVMSSALIESLTTNPSQTYIQLLESTRNIIIRKNYQQFPQLSSSHPMDMNAYFSL